jgi:CHAT domain-containing protein
VLKDQDDSDKLPFGWSPLALDTGKAGGLLSDWMLLPLNAVDQVILPGFHTPAEYALKRGGTGDEVFLATCGLMASGCRTILLSRWRVGGQSTIDLVREFVQELPHEPANVAWRRSIQLARDRMLDPSLEPRLKTSSKAKSVKADHPFFWSGYMLVDTGVVPKETAEKPNAAGE